MVNSRKIEELEEAYDQARRTIKRKREDAEWQYRELRMFFETVTRDAIDEYTHTHENPDPEIVRGGERIFTQYSEASDRSYKKFMAKLDDDEERINAEYRRSLDRAEEE